MLKNKILKRITSGLAIVSCVASCVILTGCGDIVISGRNGEATVNSAYNASYDEAKYFVGEQQYSGEITSLNIDWLDGSVDISYHAEDTIDIREEYAANDNDLTKMRSCFENGALDIRYFSRACMEPALNKKLYVVLPEGTKLSEFDFDATSAKLSFEKIETGRFVLNSTSGTMTCDELLATGEVTIDVTSADININKTLCADSVSFNSTSGSITVSGATIDSKIDIDSTSGSATFDFDKVCNINHNSTSGNLEVALPSDASLTIVHDATSGSTDINLPVMIENDKYVIGTGDYKLSSDTTSGSVIVNIKQ